MAQATKITRGSRQLARWLVAAIFATLIALGAWIAFGQLSADSLRRDAQRAEAQGNFPAAIELYERYLAQRSEDAQAHFLAARAARHAKNFRRAKELLDRAEQLGWVPNAILLERSLLRVLRGGLQTEEAFLRACIDGNHPDSVQIFEVLIPAYMQSFEIPNALYLLDRWTKVDPTNAIPHFTRGELLENMRRKDDALAAYRAGLALAPEDVDGHLKCGELLLNGKRWEDALHHYETARQRRPDSTPARRGLVKCRIGLGELGEARRLLDELLAENPRDGDSLTELGRLQWRSGDPITAERTLRQAVAILPSEPDLLYFLGQVLEQNGKSQEAAKCWEKQAAIDADIKRVRELMQVVSTKPDQPQPWFEIAQIYLRNGQDQFALDWLNRTIRLHPTFSPAHEALAEYFDKKEPARAEAHRRLAKQFANIKWPTPKDGKPKP